MKKNVIPVLIVFLYTVLIFSLYAEPIPTAVPTPESPSIDYIYPRSAVPGDEITIRGSGFGMERKDSLVYLNEKPIENYTSWMPKQISFKLSDDIMPDFVNCYVTANKISTEKKYFEVIPRIDTISPSSGYKNSIITLTGVGFGNFPSNFGNHVSIVCYNSYTIRVRKYWEWTPTKIVFSFPRPTRSTHIRYTPAICDVYVEINRRQSEKCQFFLIH